ncbi:MFS transporter [Pseudonocardia endophytica]|uniref:EmrB/QacA subfamily drug resistance transporter n=1 Tax=Pseudonocardia endophytica TaxID=401976 RepID=A0A4R1HSC0_PSEEN|nr:MFS transporter [Pseudonocardia endophytica]TCK22739.1 EmrB/QacA subfamily drug resistance transporter [Pseudonocardia endophytica]
MTTADPAPDPRRWQALWVCLVAGFMTLLDVSIVNVALPSMQTGLGASSAELSWVVSGYALTFGLVLVSSGRLGDDRGRRRMFLISLALFTLTSALAGLATNPTFLVVARLLQGVAGGMLNPQVVGFIQQLFRGPERGRAFGLFGTAIGISTAVGPLLGGLLIQWGGDTEGWRWVFYVNVPIGVAALVAGARLLPRDETSGERRPLDLVGALLLGAAVVAVMLPLVESEQDTASAPWWLMAVAAALLVVFVLWERVAARRHGHPLVNFALLKAPSYVWGTTLGLVYFAGFTSIFFVLTIYLQAGLGYTALESGLALTPFALGSAVSAAVGGRLVSRLGKPLVVIGLVLVVLGLLATDLLLAAGFAHAGWVVAGPLLVAGVGGGLVIAPNQTLALEDIPPRDGGTAAGVLQTGQRVGSAVGISLVGAVFFGHLASSRGDWDVAISIGLRVTVGLVALALLIGIADAVRSRRPRQATGPARPDRSPSGGAAGPPPDGPGVRGLVRHRTDGRPVPGATATLVDGGGREAGHDRAADDGSYRVPAPADGAYALVVGAPGCLPEVTWVTIGPGAVVRDVGLDPDTGGAVRAAAVPTRAADAASRATRRRPPATPAG